MDRFVEAGENLSETMYTKISKSHQFRHIPYMYYIVYSFMIKLKSITINSLFQCQTHAEKNKNAFSAEIHHQTFETVLFKTHCRKQNKKINFNCHIFPSFEGLS